jgi:CelD/BcsL family acetyltransferase involved in cellulose biosynthesis
MQVEILTSFDRLQSLEPEWNRLWRTRPERQVFTSFAWLRACWLARGGRQALHTPVVLSGGNVVGILPLVAEDSRLRFAGAPFADYNDLICAPADAPAVAATALSALERVEAPLRHCILENLPEGSALVSGLERLKPSMRSRMRLLPGQSCPTLLLGEEREEILTGILSKRSLKRHQNKLRRLGALRFHHLEDRGEIRRHLPRFFDQHIHRRALAGDRSHFLEPESRLFYEHLVEALDPSRELRFGVLELDGRPLAYHLGFELNGRFTWYKPTFDVDCWDLSPGEVLLKSLFEYAQERSVEEFDFSRGDEAFKDRFANHVRQNQTLYVYARSASGAALRVYDSARERVKSRSWRPAILESALAQRGRVTETLRPLVRKSSRDDAGHGLAKRAWRALVYSRDEAIVYAADKSRKEPPVSPADSGLTLRAGALSDLAGLAPDHPDFFDERTLATARRRLRDGDRLFVSEAGGSIRHLAWAGPRTEIRVPGPRNASRVRLPLGTFLIFDWWMPEEEGGREAHSFALRGIVRRLPEDEVWTLCRVGDAATRLAIEKAGFSPRIRAGDIRLFGRLVKSWQWVMASLALMGCVEMKTPSASRTQLSASALDDTWCDGNAAQGEARSAVLRRPRGHQRPEERWLECVPEVALPVVLAERAAEPHDDEIETRHH